MKIKDYLLIIVLVQFVWFSSCNNEHDNEEKDEKDGDVWLMRGWLKFIKEQGGDVASLPNKFLVNTNYFEQMRLNSTEDLVTTDDYGYLNIPDQIHFYVMMDKHSLYMVQARRNDLAKTYLSIQFNSLLDRILPGGNGQGGQGGPNGPNGSNGSNGSNGPNGPNDQEQGGVVDIGNFQEGYCFRLASTSVEWTFCADTEEEKNNWLKNIRPQVKVKEDDVGGKGGIGGGESPNKAVNLPNGFGFGGVPGDGQGMPKNGAWVILQDWTECTLACGGGSSYLHRMCIPPENGGLPCRGQAIQRRECNTQPCPESEGNKTPPKLLDPIIRVMPISNRLQRYEVCVVKEGDMLLQMKVEGNQLELPVRVILNNHTVSIFSQSTFNNIYKSYELAFVTVELLTKKEDKKRCMRLGDNRVSGKYDILCVMPQALRKGESQEGAKNQWMKDIIVFRDMCGTKVDYSDQGASSPFLDAMNKDLSNDIMDMALNDQDVNKVQNKPDSLDSTQQQAAAAIDTEIKFQRLKREELQDLQEMMQIQLKNQVESEQKQEKDCVKNEMKAENKQIIKKMQFEKEDMENEFKATQKETIMKTRSKANFQMEKDKLIAARKLKAQKERLFVIKEKIGKEVVDESRMGDQKKCDPVKVKDKAQKKFCEEKYSDRPYIYVDCIKSAANFCFACCEYQFGALQQEGRENCYKQCLDQQFNQKNTRLKAIKSSPNSPLDITTQQKNEDYIFK